MAELPLDQAIPRFKTNENRINVFVNGNNTATMTTSDGSVIPSVAKMAKEITDSSAALLAAKETEINVGAESILAGAEAARDDAETARDITVTARDVTTTARDEAVTARDEAVAAADSVSSDIAAQIHGATDYETLLADDEIGFRKDTTGLLGKIKQSSFLTWLRTALAASLTQAGSVELATNEEVATGTDNSRAVVPSALKAVIDAFTFVKKDAVNQAITGGGVVTYLALGVGGTVSSGTVIVNVGARPGQNYNNAGAHLLSPGANHGSCSLDIINVTGAGTITPTGFSKVVGAFNNTVGSKFSCTIKVGPAGSVLYIVAH